MKKDFTPGEWKQSHRKIPNNKKGMYDTQIYTEDGETIATVSWYPRPQEKGIQDGKNVLITGTYREANAKLIACAPTLLEALEELIQVKEWKDKYGKDAQYLKAQPIAWENAKKVLEKALT